MIQKFKNFDKDEFLAKKNAVKEANEPDTDVMEMPKIDVTPEEEEEAITGTPVYENPYLLKISNIILKKLDRAELGEFGVGYNVVYLNNEPGVRIFQIDGDKTLASVRRADSGGTISIAGNKKISSLEKEFDTAFGLYAQVCYTDKDGKRYYTSGSSDAMTLSAFNALCEKNGCKKGVYR